MRLPSGQTTRKATGVRGSLSPGPQWTIGKQEVMALWLVRAGRLGEHEERFFTSNRIFLTWEGLEGRDLSGAKDFDGVKAILRTAFPDVSARALGNWTGQVWAFAVVMKAGDWVAVPRKATPTIAFGEVDGPYHYDPFGDHLYRHSRTVKWLNQGIPRSTLDLDLMYSFGSLLTICQIQRNDAEKRIRALGKVGWKSAAPAGRPAHSGNGVTEPEDAPVDLERLARDQIASLIIQKYKGHGLARLVEAVLQAQGYTTYRSPEGPDKGIDLLAAPGPLGFGQLRLCVQVKSSDAPVDLATLNQLIGSMQNVHADQGLLVSWSDFKVTVERELPTQFFRVRLWGQDDLIRELLATYEPLDETIRAELPLKRIWMRAVQEDED